MYNKISNRYCYRLLKTKNKKCAYHVRIELKKYLVKTNIGDFMSIWNKEEVKYLLKEIFIVSDVVVNENRRNADEEVALGVQVERAEGISYVAVFPNAEENTEIRYEEKTSLNDDAKNYKVYGDT